MTLEVCKLTGLAEPFIKAHVIPAAFTKRVFPEQPLIEADGVSRPVRRWTGWYDRSLVGAIGENILARYDDYAHKTLANGGWLVRSGLRHSNLSPGDVISIKDVDVAKIRLFGLSLLWRAAVSSSKPFREIILGDQPLERVRNCLLKQKANDIHFHPVYFSIFDQVEEENLSPICIDLEGEKFARFYLDGAIMYVGMEASSRVSRRLGNLIVGKTSTIVAIVVPYDKSWQSKIVTSTAVETFNRWGFPWQMSDHHG